MDTRNKLVLRQPATNWQDGLPSGNGTVGALVYGNIAQDRIVLNHEAIFRRTPRPEIPSVSQHLPEWRKMLADGRYHEAAKFLYRKMEKQGFKKPRGADPFQPAFDLGIHMRTPEPFSIYRRMLDFETGEVTVWWKAGETAFKRKLFVSRTDDVVALSIEADRPSAITCELQLYPHPLGRAGGPNSGATAEIPEIGLSFERFAEDDWLTIKGRFEIGDEFGGLARVVASGGQMDTSDEVVRVSGANEVVVVLKLFANEESKKALKRLRTEIERLEPDYAALLGRHVPLHRGLLDRVKLDLGAGEERKLTTDELLMQTYDGSLSAALVEKMFDYGRYLLISSSRPGGLPANLQGVWNGSYSPSWSCDYHNDWNIQMNYWQALPSSIPEVTLPYFDYYEWSVPDYRISARQIYGCRGILAPMAQTTHGLIDAGAGGRWTGTQISWTAGAGWLAQLFFDYWLFTGDRDFLANRAVPFMKEVALFYEDFTFEGEDGKLVFSPSMSPENVPGNLMPPGSNPAIVTINATMDIAVARELLTNLCAACEELGIEEDGRRRWQEMLAKLPDYETNEDGVMKEWLWPGLSDNYEHRHMSHLYPLFPGIEATPESDPRLCEAIRAAVDRRLANRSTVASLSYPHVASVYARLEDGAHALKCLELLIKACVPPNLFVRVFDWRAQGLTMKTQLDAPEPAFQIDSNFGFPAAVLEMLVYSRPGLVKLLPALPKEWTRGKVEGVGCRGGIKASIEWDMAAGRVQAELTSKSVQTVTVKLPGVPKSLDCRPDKDIISPSDLGEAYRIVELPAGQGVCLSVRL